VKYIGFGYDAPPPPSDEAKEEMNAGANNVGKDRKKPEVM